MGILRLDRPLLSAIVVVVSVLTAGCGNEVDAHSTEESPGATSTPTATVSDDPDDDEVAGSATDPLARRALRAAFVRLMRANTGHYAVTVPFASDYLIEEQGQYQISPLVYAGVRDLTSPEGSLRLAYRGVDGETWVRLESATSADGQSTSWPCWVNYAEAASLRGFPAELAQAPTDQPPAAIVAASYGIGMRSLHAESIEGITDLALAMGLVNNKLIVATGIDAQGDDTVPAKFQLDGKTLSGFSVQIADFPDAIESAGGDLPPEIEAMGSLTTALTTRFFDVGQRVSVTAPPVNEQLTFTSADDFDSAMNSCGSR